MGKALPARAGYCYYFTRHLPLRLRERMRMLAINDGIAMEEIHTQALEIGVTLMERARRRDDESTRDNRGTSRDDGRSEREKAFAHCNRL